MLIRKYGEPVYVQIVRKSIGYFRYTLRAASNRTGRSLDYLGLHRTRQFLANMKNRLLGKKTSGSKNFMQNRISKVDTEIRYGLEACQKAIRKSKSA